VARLVPSAGGIDRSQAQAAVRRIRERVSQIKPRSFDWALLKADRDAGRP
jgi:hypothetical protein